MPSQLRSVLVGLALQFFSSFLAADVGLRLTDLGAGDDDGLDGLDAAIVGDDLYFVGAAGAANRALYRYDGVTAPTLVPGSAAPEPEELIAWNDKLYFRGGTSDRELWSYDPSTGILALALDVRPGGNGLPQRFAVADGRLCFGAQSGTVGFELFCWDGTHPVQLFDLAPGTDSSFPVYLTTWGTRLAFVTQIDGESALWIYDGTNPPAAVAAAPGEPFESPASLTPDGDELYFQASESGGTARHWRYDGLLPPARLSLTYSPWGEAGTPRGVQLMSGEDPALGVPDPELWRLSGGQLRRAAPGVTVGSQLSPVDTGGAVAFLGETVPGSGEFSLFRYCGRTALAPSDAVGAGTPSAAVIVSERIVSFKGLILLTAADNAHGEELWSVTFSALQCDDFERGDTLNWD